MASTGQLLSAERRAIEGRQMPSGTGGFSPRIGEETGCQTETAAVEDAGVQVHWPMLVQAEMNVTELPSGVPNTCEGALFKKHKDASRGWKLRWCRLRLCVFYWRICSWEERAPNWKGSGGSWFPFSSSSLATTKKQNAAALVSRGRLDLREPGVAVRVRKELWRFDISMAGCLREFSFRAPSQGDFVKWSNSLSSHLSHAERFRTETESRLPAFLSLRASLKFWKDPRALQKGGERHHEDFFLPPFDGHQEGDPNEEFKISFQRDAKGRNKWEEEGRRRLMRAGREVELKMAAMGGGRKETSEVVKETKRQKEICQMRAKWMKIRLGLQAEVHEQRKLREKRATTASALREKFEVWSLAQKFPSLFGTGEETELQTAARVVDSLYPPMPDTTPAAPRFARFPSEEAFRSAALAGRSPAEWGKKPRKVEGGAGGASNSQSRSRSRSPEERRGERGKGKVLGEETRTPRFATEGEEEKDKEDVDGRGEGGDRAKAKGDKEEQRRKDPSLEMAWHALFGTRAPPPEENNSEVDPKGEFWKTTRERLPLFDPPSEVSEVFRIQREAAALGQKRERERLQRAMAMRYQSFIDPLHPVDRHAEVRCQDLSPVLQNGTAAQAFQPAPFPDSTGLSASFQREWHQRRIDEVNRRVIESGHVPQPSLFVSCMRTAGGFDQGGTAARNTATLMRNRKIYLHSSRMLRPLDEGKVNRLALDASSLRRETLGDSGPLPPTVSARFIPRLGENEGLMMAQDPFDTHWPRNIDIQRGLWQDGLEGQIQAPSFQAVRLSRQGHPGPQFLIADEEGDVEFEEGQFLPSTLEDYQKSVVKNRTPSSIAQMRFLRDPNPQPHDVVQAQDQTHDCQRHCTATSAPAFTDQVKLKCV